MGGGQETIMQFVVALQPPLVAQHSNGDTVVDAAVTIPVTLVLIYMVSLTSVLFVLYNILCKHPKSVFTRQHGNTEYDTS